MPPRSPDCDFALDVDDGIVDAFRRDGFVSIPRITAAEEVEWLGAVFGELFASRRSGIPGGYFDLSRPYDSPGEDHLPQVLYPELVVPELRDTTYHRNAKAVAALLLGVTIDELSSWAHMIDKPPGHGAPTPWHQDEAYWDPQITYLAVSAWMPLDPVDTDNGCMCFIPGSHRGAVQTHRHINDDPAVHGLEVLEIDDATMVPVPLAAGGVTFHHPRTLHYTPPNASTRPRRALAFAFQTAPMPAEQSDDRPWIAAGRQAWAERANDG